MSFSKTCTKCKTDLPIDQYHKKASSKDGLHSACKPCVLEANRKWQAANREYLSETQRGYFKRYYEANRAHRAEVNRRWVQENPEKHKEKALRRRAKQASNGVYVIPRKFMSHLYSSPCIYCGSKLFIEADHVMPIVRGGVHSMGNLVPACRACNRSKHDYTVTEWRKRQKAAA